MRRLASARRHHQQRVRDQGQQRQPGRQLKQQRQRGRVHQRGVEHVEQPGPVKRAHRGQVVRQARHDVAGRVAPVERGVQPGQVAQQVAAQPVFDVPGGIEDEDSRPGPDQPLQDREHDDRDRVAHDDPVRHRRCQRAKGVDRLLEQPRDRQREGVRSDQAKAPENDSAELGSQGVRERVLRRGIHRQIHAGSIHDLRRIFSLNDRNSRVYSRGLAATAATPVPGLTQP